MSNQVNQNLETVKDVFKSVAWDNVTEAAFALIIAEVPWLGVPIIKSFSKLIFNFFTERLFQAVSLALDIGAIKILNPIAQKEYERESLRLYVIAREKGLNSEEYRRNRNEAKISLSRFVRYNF